MRLLLAALAVWLPAAAFAEGEIALVRRAVDEHILPGYAALSSATATLDQAARADCAPGSPDLRASYDAAFDAWMGVSHLRFGPSEIDNRAFALAFWPDERGATPKTLAGLIADADPIVDDPAAYGEVSVAARGFFALEMMLYDPQFTESDPDYSCRLIRAIAGDIALTAAFIETDWKEGYAELITSPGQENPIYFTELELLQALYNALMSGLEFTADRRLALPLGTFERPRPTRAEARRSGRSLRNVAHSIEATGDLAEILAGDLPPARRAPLAEAIGHAEREAAGLGDPVFAGVETPTGRLRVEILQQAVNGIRDAARTVIGPALGVSQGFNSMDGD